VALPTPARDVVKAVPPEHLEGRGLRVSTHFYNTDAELDRLVEGVKQVL
jgi:selenocysteine lyase/cysteine desulfurase